MLTIWMQPPAELTTKCSSSVSVSCIGFPTPVALGGRARGTAEESVYAFSTSRFYWTLYTRCLCLFLIHCLLVGTFLAAITSKVALCGVELGISQLDLRFRIRCLLAVLTAGDCLLAADAAPSCPISIFGNDHRFFGLFFVMCAATTAFRFFIDRMLTALASTFAILGKIEHTARAFGACVLIRTLHTVIKGCATSFAGLLTGCVCG